MSAMHLIAAEKRTSREVRDVPILFSNSGFRCQALRDHPCRAHCSLRGRACPPHDGVRRRWWINVASAVSLIESSQKIGRSRHRHRPGRDIFSRRTAGTLWSRYCSLRRNLLLRPVELGSVHPHAMQNDRQLARDGDCGLSEPIALGEPPKPLAPTISARGSATRGRFEKITAEHSVTTLRDASRPVDLPRSMASGRQSDISPNTS